MKSATVVGVKTSQLYYRLLQAVICAKYRILRIQPFSNRDALEDGIRFRSLYILKLGERQE